MARNERKRVRPFPRGRKITDLRRKKRSNLAARSLIK